MLLSFQSDGNQNLVNRFAEKAPRYDYEHGRDLYPRETHQGKEAGVVQGVCTPFQGHFAPPVTPHAGLPEVAQVGVGVRGKTKRGLESAEAFSL